MDKSHEAKQIQKESYIPGVYALQENYEIWQDQATRTRSQK